jgi:hypothetical protein
MHCVRCSEELIAPERSEYWSDGHACHVWRCPKCSACFGSLVLFPTETESMKDIVTGETIFPSFRRCWSARPERATVIRVSPVESEIRCK